MRYSENFKENIVGIGFETLENSSASIYAISKDFEIIYYNKSYENFAVANDKSNKTITKYGLGSNILNGISSKEIAKFYTSQYELIFANGKPMQHTYECSSSKIFRKFCQQILPLKNGIGLIIINNLDQQKPIQKKNKGKENLSENEYRNSKGIIVQCTNCRHTKKADSEEWDWIKDWIDEMPINISHSICPTCYDYYWKFAKIKYEKI